MPGEIREFEDLTGRPHRLGPLHGLLLLADLGYTQLMPLCAADHPAIDTEYQMRWRRRPGRQVCLGWLTFTLPTECLLRSWAVEPMVPLADAIGAWASAVRAMTGTAPSDDVLDRMGPSARCLPAPLREEYARALRAYQSEVLAVWHDQVYGMGFRHPSM